MNALGWVAIAVALLWIIRRIWRVVRATDRPAKDFASHDDAFQRRDDE